jgi:hypothetical protein
MTIPQWTDHLKTKVSDVLKVDHKHESKLIDKVKDN